jgi:2-keto-4-pentenoate hydratase/2-oxohepta-3-ene-1,7-dioic acid hydratase in catechol pathway
MTFPSDFLVSYHSQIMTMLPGDIISTGTPGATPLKNGDIIECRISGFEPLMNHVIDLKLEEGGKV